MKTRPIRDSPSYSTIAVLPILKSRSPNEEISYLSASFSFRALPHFGITEPQYYICRCCLSGPSGPLVCSCDRADLDHLAIAFQRLAEIRDHHDPDNDCLLHLWPGVYRDRVGFWGARPAPVFGAYLCWHSRAAGNPDPLESQ